MAKMSDDVFFELLATEAKNAEKAATLLDELMKGNFKAWEKRNQIKDVEHKNDATVHEIYYMLNQTKEITLDGSDIGKLASLYDDVVDLIFGVVNRIYLFEIKKPTKTMKEFTRIIREQVKAINKALENIKEMKKSEMEKNCIEIHKLENEADELFYEEIASLFKLKDAVEIIKMKEIYQYLEKTTDKCEDVSNAIMDIRVKYG